MIFSFAIGCAWILGSAAWQRVDSHDPRKQFADEVRSEIRVSLRHYIVQLRHRLADWRRKPSTPVDGRPPE
jgi:hypothetical protein